MSASHKPRVDIHAYMAELAARIAALETIRDSGSRHAKRKVMPELVRLKLEQASLRGRSLLILGDHRSEQGAAASPPGKARKAAHED